LGEAQTSQQYFVEVGSKTAKCADESAAKANTLTIAMAASLHKPNEKVAEIFRLIPLSPTEPPIEHGFMSPILSGPAAQGKLKNLLDQVRDVMPFKHYSLRTSKCGMTPSRMNRGRE
jgi:hypothetical protein